MSSVISSIGEEPPRKKVRKGTFSCWECKRRKIRCAFRSEDDLTCTGCRSRGIECHSQKSFDEDVAASVTRSIPDRVGRLESLVETYIQNLIEVLQNGDHSSSDVLTPLSSTMSNVPNPAPVLSLFNNGILDSNHTSEKLRNRDAARLGSYSQIGTSSSSAERKRQTLLALIPSQPQLESIFKSAGDWWRLWHYCYPGICERGESSSLADFISRAHSESHLATIASVLLCIAVSIQRLPSTFCFSSIHVGCSAKEIVEEYTSAVVSLVASDDELTASIEGLECLVLLGKIYMDAGKPRKGWLSFRRAMNLAEIIGLHRHSVRSFIGSDGITVSRKTSVWWQIYQADRLLSVLLGFSRGISDEFCDLDICDEKTETAYIKKVAKLAGQVCDRNQAVSGPSYVATQELEEKLRILSTEMPQSWWSLQTAATDLDGFDIIGRFLAQLWHYQVEQLLHLPFMLRSINEPKYEYNKYMCLKASRDIIERLMYLRNTQHSFLKSCKMVEFQAFIAAVVLQLNLLNHQSAFLSENSLRILDDSQKVDQVMKELSRHPSDGNSVAAQAVEVLETLKAVITNDSTIGSSFVLKIPYFGTISIRREERVCPTNSDSSSSLRLSPTDAHQQPVAANIQSNTFMPPMDDGSVPKGGSLEFPQISFTSSLFTSSNETLTHWSEDDWSLLSPDMQFENSRISDLDGTWDCFGVSNH